MCNICRHDITKHDPNHGIGLDIPCTECENGWCLATEEQLQTTW